MLENKSNTEKPKCGLSFYVGSDSIFTDCRSLHLPTMEPAKSACQLWSQEFKHQLTNVSIWMFFPLNILTKSVSGSGRQRYSREAHNDVQIANGRKTEGNALRMHICQNMCEDIICVVGLDLSIGDPSPRNFRFVEDADYRHTLSV